jgi:hypothetical protein
MRAAPRTSETLQTFYQTTRCYNPEDSNLHTHRRENLKSDCRLELRALLSVYVRLMGPQEEATMEKLVSCPILSKPKHHVLTSPVVKVIIIEKAEN